MKYGILQVSEMFLHKVLCLPRDVNIIGNRDEMVDLLLTGDSLPLECEEKLIDPPILVGLTTLHQDGTVTVRFEIAKG